MAFFYRKSIDEALATGKPFTLNSTYAATAAAGDVVSLNGSGHVVLATTSDTKVLGVVQGFVFEGLGVTPKVALVNVDPESIYEAEYVGTALTIANVGSEYGINGASQLDTADTATPIVKLIEIVNGKHYVAISKRTLI